MADAVWVAVVPVENEDVLRTSFGGIERVFRAARPLSMLSFVLAVLWAPRPELALVGALALVATREAVGRQLGRIPVGRMLALLSASIPVFVYLAGPSPVAWVPAITPILSACFLFRLRAAWPFALALSIGPPVGLAASGAALELAIAAAVALVLIFLSALPIAAELDLICVEMADVTKEAERATAFNELVLQTSPYLIFVKDSDSGMVKVNKTYLDFADVEDVEEVLGRAYLEVLPPAAVQDVLRGDREALENGRSASELVLPKRGQDRVLVVDKVAFEGPGGETFLLNTAVDVTEDRAAVADLESTRQELQRTLDAMNDGLWEAAYVEDRIEFSPRYKELIGYDPDAEYGPLTIEEWLNEVHPDEKEGVRTAMVRHVRDDTPFDVELRLRAKDGNYRHFRTRGRAERDGTGRAFRATGAIQDISRSKAQERALIEARSQALAAVEARSAFLANMSHEIRTPINGVLGMLQILTESGLEDHQRQPAEMATKSAESLLGIINDILDISKVEAGKLLIESVRFDLRQVLGEVVEALGPVAQGKGLDLVLDLQGVPAGTVEGDPVRLRQVLTNLLSNGIKFTRDGEVVVRAEIEDMGEGLRLRCAVSDTGIGIDTDQIEKLFQAFTQADASTTRVFGGTGLGLSITQQLCGLMGGRVWAKSVKGEGSIFTFELLLSRGEASLLEGLDHGRSVGVVDSSPTRRAAVAGQLRAWGIDAQMAVSLESLDISTDLDLILVDEGVEANAGSVAATLQQRGWAGKLIFMVSLSELAHQTQPAVAKPLTDRGYRSIAHALGAPTRTEVPTSPEAPRLEGVRVLLVEDNHVNQIVALRLLRGRGAVVEVAGDGLEALDHLRGARFDVVLMDCQMPRMDGFAATRAIRAGEGGPEAKSIPIVALTANALQGDRDRCLDAGMTNFLTKPFRVETLAMMVSTALKGP